MSRSPARRSPAQNSLLAFTLPEVVIALAIIATAMVAVLGLLPAGLDASRQAANQTVIAVILEDLHNRLLNQPLKSGPASFSPAFFDDHGVFLDPQAANSDPSRRLYRADVQVSDWRDRPAKTSGLRPVTIALSWPVNAKTGEALGTDNPHTVVTFGVTPLTGLNWAAIDPNYVPKIEY